MKKLSRLILSGALTLSAALCASSCHSIEQWDDDPQGNFEALWTVVDEHYCFFAEKGVDWDAVHAAYAPRIRPNMTRTELFGVCAEMLAELRDGHTNLIAPFEVSYYRQWWSDYPENFDLRVIQQYYFNFNYKQTSGMTYGMLTDNVGYLYYPSFSATVGEGNLDWVLTDLNTASGLIIDVRGNGGGEMSNVERLVSRFIDREMLAGYISHKTGPGHNDFSEPYAYHYRPAGDGHYLWGKPVVVLTNRGTFSAANNFVSVMKSIPGVKIVGATTGGGSGMPFNSEIPNGWGVRFSACSVLDPAGRPTEDGVTPSEGCEVTIAPEQTAQGIDPILDFAIGMLTNS
ncbi:MAG: S41 family peptidase [Candidatus Amulumruptor caecigallinarius]|nr:S41 family peptidase [Candidatus Amulumruptor caecigallinarius]MCM1396424.1 S41 family peptidase [Candidatus Amulumruptor caecigallinarius]MCM1453519.1 S41 family peptidase [bacterium]